MRIKNLPSIESMDGSQDALVIEQTDGSEDKSRKVSPAQIKQYVLGEVDEVPTQDSDNLVKSGGIFSTMAVPKYDETNRREYFEGGAAFDGNIDSVPTAGSNNAVASGGVYTALNNVETTSGSGSYGCSYTAYKYGKVVNLFVTGITNATTGQSMTLFTLPEGWRPRAQARAYGSINMGTLSGSGVIGFNIYANGRCDTYSYSALSGGGFTISYITT